MYIEIEPPIHGDELEEENSHDETKESSDIQPEQTTIRFTSTTTESSKVVENSPMTKTEQERATEA